MDLADLGVAAWLLLVVGAIAVGFAKTAVGGVGALAVVAFAAAVPARNSTGALLPLLLVGDIVAVKVYHRHADRTVLLRLLPGVLPGLLLGVWFLAIADDTVMRRSIGLMLLAMTAIQAWTRRTRVVSNDGRRRRAHPIVTLVMGATAGFATMMANAAGPVTTLYLLAAGLPMLEFLGTTAWFYLLVNAAKLPFSAGLDLISWDSLLVDALLVPALGLGALTGIALVRRIDQAQFERAALVLAGLAAVALLL
jgi:uncharacterized membrane protein YfcA